MSLSGHVSKSMLERYSHTRIHAKRAAIAALEQAAEGATSAAKRDASATVDPVLTEGVFEEEGAQNWAQSPTVPPRVLS
jgi:hypothetical protein